MDRRTPESSATQCCAYHRRNEPEPGTLSRRGLIRGGLAAGAALAIAPKLVTPASASMPAAATRGAERAATRPSAAPAAPSVIRRSQWGADETRRGGPAYYDGVAQKIVVHHTGTDNGVTDWAGQVRQIYDFELANGYRDIAYHYLVDPNGRVYEGRWARDYPAGFSPDAQDTYGRLVRGGHAKGHNQRTLGIALLGDYTKIAPSRAAVEALAALVAWRCARWRIDPLATGPFRNDSGQSNVLPNILGHGQVRATECPGTHLSSMLPHLRSRVSELLGTRRSARGGYWIIAGDGREAAFGNAPGLRSGSEPRYSASGIAAHPSGQGYWAYGRDGGVFAFGASRFHGSLGGQRLNAPVTGLAPTPTGDGYWLCSADGGVFAFGDAGYHGSLADTLLNGPVVAVRSSHTGKGYLLCSADGGVFAFGDAHYRGGITGVALRAPIVDMGTARDGYWLAGRDGGVFAFGDVPYAGGGASAPVAAMQPTTTGKGYLLLTSEGDVLPFGDAPYHGDVAGSLPGAVGIAGRLLPEPV